MTAALETNDTLHHRPQCNGGELKQIMGPLFGTGAGG
jgi:hypothetical protein